MAVSSIKDYIIMFLFLFFTISMSSFACEGQERDEVLRIIYESLEAGYQGAMTGDIDSMIRKANELSLQAQQLSPPCQALIEQVGHNLQNSYNPNTTSCFGGVCCDGTGCVNN